jgi:hypothetical protein
MEPASFVVGMTKALAWPLTAVGIAITFRAQFEKLLDRLVHLRAPGVEADFGEKLDEVEENLPPETKAQSKAAADAASQVDTNLPPDYLIIDSWRKLEDRLTTLSAKRGLGDRRGTFRDPLLIARRLEIPDEALKSIQALRSIRNDAVHSTASKPTMTDALRYASLAADVLSSLPEA